MIKKILFILIYVVQIYVYQNQGHYNQSQNYYI